MQKTLPQRPSLDQLRRQAKDLLKQLQQHDSVALHRLRESHPDFQRAKASDRQPAAFALNQAQLIIAREHGFASWTRLKRQVELLALDEQERVESFIQSALVDYRDPKGMNFERAQMIMEAEPDVVQKSFHAALVAGEAGEVERHIARGKGQGLKNGGLKKWEPLLYVCFSRFLQRDESRKSGFENIVKLLLRAGADSNAFFMVNDDPNARQTCLYGAAGIANDAVITKLLLDAGADPNDGAPGLGPESLYHAAEHQNVECLRLILNAKPDPEKVSYCLGRCLDFENPEGVKVFLEAGADPNYVRPGGGDGSTRLHGAIRNGRSAEVIHLLLEAGADWARESHDGMTPYRLAIRTGQFEAAGQMEKLGADPGSATKVDFLVGSCLAADSDRLLEPRDAIRKQIARMQPADLAMISVAAYLQRPEAVRLMVDLGFPIDTYGPERMTALHWACWVGNFELAAFLIDHGADIELHNGYGGTALGCAVWASIHRDGDADYAPLVRLLLDRGAVTEDTCAYPTRIPAIDALLKPYFEESKPNRGEDHVQMLAEENQLLAARYPDTAKVNEIVEIWANAVMKEHANKAGWTAVLLSNWSPALTGKSATEILRTVLSESDAFDSAARYFGFKSWENVGNDESLRLDSRFEAAVDAVVGGKTETLSRLLRETPGLVSQRSAFGHRCTLLHYVAANGVEIHRQTVPPNAVEIARLLLEAGAEPDALAETYGGGLTQTTLSLLITSGHPHDAGLVEPLIELLVEYGGNVDGLENNGQPLQVTLDFGYTQTAQTLIRLGASVFTVSQAAGVGRLADLLRLLENKPVPKELNNALYLAARNGQMNCLKPLIDAGADLNARGWFGSPALHWAAMNGHESVVKFLMNQGADPNLRDERFHAHAAGWANENGHAQIRDWLLDNGCTASVVEAAAFGRIDLVKKHLERDPESVNTNEGRSPLHEAAGRGNVELLELLLANGADRFAKDEDGLTSLDWAQHKKQDVIARLLESV